MSYSPSASLPVSLRTLFSSSSVALTLADLNSGDQPLIGVTDAFCSMTGYPAGEVLGRNCRFLQPSDGGQLVRTRIREFLITPSEANGRFVLANVRKDGSPFLNVLYLSKLRSDGDRRFVLGSQFVVGGAQSAENYERALMEDLTSLGDLHSPGRGCIASSMDAIAGTAALLANYHMELVRD